MVKCEACKIEYYDRILSNPIRDDVISTKTTSLHDTINWVRTRMNSVIGGVVAEIKKHKRKWEDIARGDRKSNGPQEVIEAYAVRAGEK